MFTKLRFAAVLGAAALALPAAAVAKPGPKHHVKPVKMATFIVKGVWHADGTVTVAGGNSRVRKAHLKGETVAFDVTGAKLRVADTNADGAITAADLAEGDKVVVQARLPRGTDLTAGVNAARKVVDQTHPRVAEAEVEQD